MLGENQGTIWWDCDTIWCKFWFDKNRTTI